MLVGGLQHTPSSIIHSLRGNAFAGHWHVRNLNTLTQHYVIPIKLFQVFERLLRLALRVLELEEYKYSVISRSCCNSGHVS